MARSNDDRVLVARVRVERGDETEEIRSCWVSVTPALNRIGIWLTRDEHDPTMLVSLDQVSIDWLNMEPQMLA